MKIGLKSLNKFEKKDKTTLPPTSGQQRRKIVSNQPLNANAILNSIGEYSIRQGMAPEEA
jgi:hypothetical protein